MKLNNRNRIACTIKNRVSTSTLNSVLKAVSGWAAPALCEKAFSIYSLTLVRTFCSFSFCLLMPNGSQRCTFVCIFAMHCGTLLSALKNPYVLHAII